jgi:hypothetical protein
MWASGSGSPRHFLGERHTLQNHHGSAGSGTFYSTVMSYRGEQKDDDEEEEFIPVPG